MLDGQVGDSSRPSEDRISSSFGASTSQEDADNLAGHHQRLYCDYDSVASSKQQQRQQRKLYKGTWRQQLRHAMRLSGTEHVKAFMDPVLDTKAVLAWNRHTLILAFRGTASLRNALSDIKVRAQAALCTSETCFAQLMGMSSSTL